MSDNDTALQSQTAGEPEIPDELPVLPVRDTVLFPHAVMPLNIGRESSIALVQSLGENKYFGVVAQKDPRVDEPSADEMYHIGTLAVIHKSVRMPNNSLLIFCEGLARIEVQEYLAEKPFFRIKYGRIEEPKGEPAQEVEALRRNAISIFEEIVQLSPSLSDDIPAMVNNIEDPGRTADFMAATLPGLSSSIKQQILETIGVRQRLEDLVRALVKERELLELRNKISSQVQDQLSQSQREFYLREQMKAIQKELGEDEDHAEVEDLRKKIDEAGMPEGVRKEAHRELQRLSRMSPAAADFTVTRTYLDWLVALPWAKSSGEEVNVVKAHEVLDADHYDLEKIKERILDYLSVLQLKPTLKGPILCFVGPPGVGKTSLGKSIARALGRKFVRISLGGVHDEAEIRGHRRTYIGALPGQIIQGIRRAGSNDPVFMMDEIDKIGRDFRGDPSSALLEVLDPEQNNSFRDHYLDVPFDLSKVLFVTTANVLDPIPSALRDRMEILDLQGYTEAEKLKIAFQYLIPRQVAENGLEPEQISFSEVAVSHLIRRYTREAGVRNLEREIGTVCRKRARRLAEERSTKAANGSRRRKKSKGPSLTISPAVIEEFLGAPKILKEAEIAERTSKPGVAVGLAWTPAGGDVLFIEASQMPGGGKGMILTGHLGQVMQESMQAALSWVRANAASIGIDPAFNKKTDLHLHVPAGAIPKDGPSAGVTVVSALVSLLTGRRVRSNLAMTGETTLSGLVLPVGGIKEKVLAARRAGVKDVILPAENEVHVKEDLKAEQLGDLKIHYVGTIQEVIDIALEAKPAPSNGTRPAAAAAKSGRSGRRPPAREVSSDGRTAPKKASRKKAARKKSARARR